MNAFVSRTGLVHSALGVCLTAGIYPIGKATARPHWRL